MLAAASSVVRAITRTRCLPAFGVKPSRVLGFSFLLLIAALHVFCHGDGQTNHANVLSHT